MFCGVACALRKVWQCCRSRSDSFSSDTNENSFGLQFKDKGLTFATRNHSSIVIAVYYKMLLLFISSCSSEIFLLLYTGIQ